MNSDEANKMDKGSLVEALVEMFRKDIKKQPVSQLRHQYIVTKALQGMPDRIRAKITKKLIAEAVGR